MQKLEEVVQSIVKDFVENSELFTALDVSNKVKEFLPLSRHRDVRDLVRNLFSTEMDPATYVRSPITVTLEDGSTTEALLYHPIEDSWDLDIKYNNQKRSKKVENFLNQTNFVGNPTVAINTVINTMTQTTQNKVTSVISSKQLWADMMKSSLPFFPLK